MLQIEYNEEANRYTRTYKNLLRLNKAPESEPISTNTHTPQRCMNTYVCTHHWWTKASQSINKSTKNSGTGKKYD